MVYRVHIGRGQEAAPGEWAGEPIAFGYIALTAVGAWSAHVEQGVTAG
jgi:hypothetical protein